MFLTANLMNIILTKAKVLTFVTTQKRHTRILSRDNYYRPGFNRPKLKCQSFLQTGDGEQFSFRIKTIHYASEPSKTVTSFVIGFSNSEF